MEWSSNWYSLVIIVSLFISRINKLLNSGGRIYVPFLPIKSKSHTSCSFLSRTVGFLGKQVFSTAGRTAKIMNCSLNFTTSNGIQEQGFRELPHSKGSIHFNSNYTARWSSIIFKHYFSPGLSLQLRLGKVPININVKCSTTLKVYETNNLQHQKVLQKSVFHQFSCPRITRGDLKRSFIYPELASCDVFENEAENGTSYFCCHSHFKCHQHFYQPRWRSKKQHASTDKNLYE